MVHLVLSSTKGNQGLRYFPYAGYLGLTPVKVEGIVRTKVDSDAKQLLAKSLTISVRCYESRLGRVSVLASKVLVDYTQVLWSKPDGEEYAPIDELEFPFRITVPARVGGFSTSVFVDYRCMWRVEAVLHHVPLTAVGSRQVKHFELPLVRFDLPPYEPSPPSPAKPLLLHQTTKPKAPRIRYSIDAPTFPIGPLDIVSIPVHLLPLDEGVIVRSATVMIERRIQLNESVSSLYPPDTPPSSPYPIPYTSNPSSPRASPSSSKASTPSSSYSEPAPSTFNGLETVSSTNSSNPTITPNSLYPSASFASDRPLLPHSFPASPSSPLHPKSIITPVIGAESSGQFTRNDQGVWTKSVTLQWPAAKSHSRWAIGETIQSELASVRFFARVKISVSSPGGTDSIELSEKELLIVSTNEAERKLAISKYNDLLSNHMERSGRSKSKSPRRSRRELDTDVPPPPAPFLSAGKQSASTGSIKVSANSSNGGRVPTPRRPHTSAGPRDNKAFENAHARLTYRAGESSKESQEVWGRKEDTTGAALMKVPSRPDTSQGMPKRRSGMGSLFSSAPKMSAALSGSSNGTSASSGTRSASSSVSSHDSHTGPVDKMREWEEELARIEMRSRRSSDMLSFFGRKRSAGAPKVG
ncbi:hypothetical protein C0991_008299 [Blastosporella zonata]|nr:hypothetical protein C0991_008299 [Blastosporella zonata]